MNGSSSPANNSNSGISQTLGGTGLGTAASSGGLAFRLNNGGMMVAETDFINNKVRNQSVIQPPPCTCYRGVNPNTSQPQPPVPRQRHQHNLTAQYYYHNHHQQRQQHCLPEATVKCCCCSYPQQQQQLLQNGRLPGSSSIRKAGKAGSSSNSGGKGREQQQQQLHDISSMLAALVCLTLTGVDPNSLSWTCMNLNLILKMQW